MAKKKKLRIWIDFFLAAVVFVWSILLVRFMLTSMADKLDYILAGLSVVLILAVITGRIKLNKVFKKIGL